MNQQELQRLTAVKAALITTTHTAGWDYIKQLSNNIVQKTVQGALDAEDPISGETKRLKAAALQKGFAELFAAVEQTTGFSLEAADDDNGLGDLEMDYAQEKV